MEYIVTMETDGSFHCS